MSKLHTYEISHRNILIQGSELHIGDGVTFGNDVQIRAHKSVVIGDHAVLGDRLTVNCESLVLGDYFYNKPTDSRGLVIGGGGSHLPFSHVRVGKRCVCHTGHWNAAQSIELGDDVGLSHDVDLLTHGFWGSVLDGYPRTFAPIKIGNNVILGWKSLVGAGVTIGNNVVVGACSVVVKNLEQSGVYVGNPAKFLRALQPITDLDYQQRKLEEICDEFQCLMQFYDVDAPRMRVTNPHIQVNNLLLDVDTLQCVGTHDPVTDAFRDHLRRYGIRIFHPRGFAFNLQRLD